MGIRFQCHHCNHPLHVKDYQAGKKGRCPECKEPFRIPLADAEYSLDPSVDLNAAGSGVSIEQDDSRLQAGINGGTAVIDTLATKQQRADNTDRVEPNSVPAPINEQTEDDGEQNYELNLTQPTCISQAPNATWYVRPATGGQYGPAPAAILWQWLLEGRIDVDALVWRDDWPQWLPSNQVFAEYFWQTQGQSAFTRDATGIPATNPSAAQANSMAESTQGLASIVIADTYGSRGANDASQTMETTTSPPAAAKRQQRKRSRRTKYMIAIGVLVFLMISLAIGLFYVLYRQGAGN